MRRSQRLIAAAVLLAFSAALAGCSSGFGNFDPSDMLDWLDTKKKLPGERKPVFPDGVPGLDQGVPRELYKGANQQPIDQQNTQAAVTPAEEPRAKRTAKSKSKGKQPAPAEAAKEPDAASDEEGGTSAAPPAPAPKKIVRRRTTVPPPDQASVQPAQPAPPPQESAAPFPAPLPGGTFTR